MRVLCSIRRTQKLGLALLFFCLVCGIAEAEDVVRGGPVIAAPAYRPFDDQYHTSWTVRDGVPTGLWQAKQTTDGFLWLTAETGLYRFDGVQFARYKPPSGQALLKDGPVTALAATSDGGLWIGYRFGGASSIRRGVVTNYPPTREFAQTAFIFLQDKDGTVWAALPTGLLRFDGKQWKRLGSEWGPKISHVDHLRLAPDGSLWVDDGTAYYVLPRGGKQFQRTGLPNGKIDIVDESAGWLTIDDVGLFPILRSADGSWRQGKLAFKENISSITHTADGSLWLGAHDGLWRLRGIDPRAPERLRPDAIQVMRAADGLTADFVYALTTDREGSLWALTANGLNQFRKTVFTKAPLPSGMHHLQLLDEGETLLVGSSFHTETSLARISAAGADPIPSPLMMVRQMIRDASGTVWLNANGAMWRLHGNKLDLVEAPEEFRPNKFKLRAITADNAGGLWVSVLTDGPDTIYHWRDGNWRKFDGVGDTSKLEVTSMMTDAAGSVWIGTGSSRIQLVEATGGVKTLDGRDGLDSGGITLLAEQGDHVWVGGAENLDYFSNGRFRRICNADGSSIQGVTGVAETANGDVWMNSSRGVLRVEAANLRSALVSPNPRISARFLQYLDGFSVPPVVRQQASTLVQMRDGRLYFVTPDDVLWVDPTRLAKNTIPPGVLVTSVVADRQTYDNPTEFELPQGTQNVRIDYTASSLLIPARVQFRYKLQGFDTDWQEVGTRRQAFYTHLPPGNYTFLVEASNNDGLRSTTTAKLGFTLPPTFVQSIWFKLLGIVALAVILAGAYHFRVKLLMAKIQSRLFERLAERERIARDLHDTFFQGIQGLFLRFNTGTSMLPANEPARQIFLEALEQSDRVMAEGRELVLDLRAEQTMHAELAEELARIEEHTSDARKTEYKVYAVGQIRRLHPVCGSELLRIGQEAVYNAFRHANATAIEVEILYEKDFLKMRIRDDGQGIDEQVIREGKKPGHLGLVGMNERAKRIGASYHLWSKKGYGTEIEVEVPAEIAYIPLHNSKYAHTLWGRWTRRIREQRRLRHG